jgi:hypothetical protein
MKNQYWGKKIIRFVFKFLLRDYSELNYSGEWWVEIELIFRAY